MEVCKRDLRTPRILDERRVAQGRPFRLRQVDR